MRSSNNTWYKKKAVKLEYISTNDKTVDIMTNPLSKEKFEHFRDKHELVEISPLIERECCLDTNMEGHSPERENGSRCPECSPRRERNIKERNIYHSKIFIYVFHSNNGVPSYGVVQRNFGLEIKF